MAAQSILRHASGLGQCAAKVTISENAGKKTATPPELKLLLTRLREVAERDEKEVDLCWSACSKKKLLRRGSGRARRSWLRARPGLIVLRRSWGSLCGRCVLHSEGEQLVSPYGNGEGREPRCESRAGRSGRQVFVACEWWSSVQSRSEEKIRQAGITTALGASRTSSRSVRVCRARRQCKRRAAVHREVASRRSCDHSVRSFAASLGFPLRSSRTP